MKNDAVRPGTAAIVATISGLVALLVLVILLLSGHGIMESLLIYLCAAMVTFIGMLVLARRGIPFQRSPYGKGR